MDTLERAVFDGAADQADHGEAIYAFVSQLYPVCRSITGAGLRETLRQIGDRIPLEITEIPSGTAVFDWEVPREWNIRDAYIKDEAGNRIVDFNRSNLHVVNYSVPIKARMSLEQLRPHLFGLPDYPEWVPYRTTYYRESWGFCLPQRQIDELKQGTYEVLIDSELKDGSLTYGECVLPGDSESEVLIFTHCCHPSTCNDNLTGVALATELAGYVAAYGRRHTYRFVFAPATIGSIAWLARNESDVSRISHGLVLGLLGDSAAFTYKRSRRGNAPIDRVAEYVMSCDYPDARVRDFSPYGYDERQFCSPGFDLPLGRLTRSSNGEYPEYHSSADNLQLVSAGKLAESFQACLKIVGIVESCKSYRNVRPKCEPRLSKYGLYRPIGGQGPDDTEFAMLWVLNQSDGSRDLVDIAIRSGLPYPLILKAAHELHKAGLVEA